VGRGKGWIGAQERGRGLAESDFDSREETKKITPITNSNEKRGKVRLEVGHSGSGKKEGGK